MNIQMMTVFALKAGSDMKYQAFSPEAWAKAAEVAVFGMVMVFLVLAILWAVLAVFKVLFGGEKKAENASVEENTAPVATVEPEPVAAQDDGELIADRELAEVVGQSEVREGSSTRVDERNGVGDHVAESVAFVRCGLGCGKCLKNFAADGVGGDRIRSVGQRSAVKKCCHSFVPFSYFYFGWLCHPLILYDAVRQNATKVKNIASLLLVGIDFCQKSEYNIFILKFETR